jgi:hypothetical protein
MPLLSREVQFTNKVFTQNDLVRLVDFFIETVVSRKKSDIYSERQRLDINTTTKDGVDYSFDESELKSLSSHFQQRQIDAFRASYSDYKTGNEINFRLNTSAYSTCYFQLKSKDEKWLDHKVARVNEYLNSIQRQENFYLSNRKWLRPVGKFILALPITYIFLVVLVLLAGVIPSSGQVELDPNQRALGAFYVYVFLLFMNVLFGDVIVARLFKYFDNLWPPIEINTGPEHLNSLHRQRKFWSILAQTVIVPLAIAILFYILGGVKLF